MGMKIIFAPSQDVIPGPVLKGRRSARESGDREESGGIARDDHAGGESGPMVDANSGEGRVIDCR